MLRIPGVILLALCVIAMPSYAAVTCGSACTSSAGTHEHDCCPDAGTVAANPSDEGTPDSDHSDGGRGHHCAAPCCGYVAHVIRAATPHVEERPLADLLPSAAALQAVVHQDAIFHPPRA